MVGHQRSPTFPTIELTDRKYTYEERPTECPVCGSKDIVTILWGLPSSPTPVDEEGRPYAIGGCLIPMDPPTWICGQCDTELHSTEDRWGFSGRFPAE